MAIKVGGLKIVPTAGTEVQLTATATRVKKILFQTEPDNTGRIWIGDANLDKSTGAGVFAILAIPTNNSIPSASLGLDQGATGVNAHDIYIDSEVNGEGVYWSYSEF